MSLPYVPHKLYFGKNLSNELHFVLRNSKRLSLELKEQYTLPLDLIYQTEQEYYASKFALLLNGATYSIQSTHIM